MFVPFFSCQSGEVDGTSAALVMVMPIDGRKTTYELLIGRGGSTIDLRLSGTWIEPEPGEDRRSVGKGQPAGLHCPLDETPSQKIQELMP
jgi:hypothetical protein